MQNLLEYILIHIVQHPDEVQISEEKTGDNSYVYTISVHQEDIGRVIGKQGSVIHSLRTIVKMRAIKDGVHAQVTVAESE